jgi:hypothetical protein
MRHLPFIVATACALWAAAPAHAATLSLDDDLLVDVAALLEREGQLPVHSSASARLGLTQARYAAAQNSAGGGGASGFGVGLQLGSPTSITFAIPMNDAKLVFGLGAAGNFGNRNFAALSLHVDYLFQVAQLINNGTVNLNFYLGPGAWLQMFGSSYGYYSFGYFGGFNTFGLAARFPIGLSLGFAAAPLEVYLELVPALFIFPGIGFDIGPALGFRWYF